ncbi:MAG: hypothetical protein KatS3mg108_2874 [Isosphaeraceae bacterium]|jgi:hypothetical protein|nr:MAG: hypothetical protein KatS3mg108_2874 [Isosphaeraceae bacterium]
MNRSKRGLVGLILATTLMVGCHKHGIRGGSLVPTALEPEGVVMEEGVVLGGAPRTSFVDRHPLLFKPRNVYHKTGHHAVVKVLAATAVGVPVGLVCEVAQIVNGCERCF